MAQHISIRSPRPDDLTTLETRRVRAAASYKRTTPAGNISSASGHPVYRCNKRRLMSSPLQNGDLFPDLAIDVVGGGTLTLPRDLAGSYSVVLFYRGSWCPYCCAQLAAFSRARERFAEVGIKIVALSIDDGITSEALVDRKSVV